MVQKNRIGLLKVRSKDNSWEDIELYELPSNWIWVENYNLALDKQNAICAGPFGTIFKAKDFRESGVPIIFLRNISPGLYQIKNPGFMDEQVWQEFHQEYSVWGGEILVAKLGDPPGACCIYPSNVGKAMVTPDVMKMEVNPSIALTQYMMYFFNSPGCKDLIEGMAFGATRSRIDLSMFKTFPIALPPLEEQHEIVRRVKTLFAKADRIETQYKKARQDVDRLTPALLAKAFRGELVPQDPTDEPAIVLLERIKAEKGSEKRGKGRSKK
jgi:type I restriction enzyme, S subunit